MTPGRSTLNGFAVDLGGTKIAAARIVASAIADRVQVATDGAAPPEAQVAAMQALLLQLGYRGSDPLGIAVAGRIDAQGHWHAVNTGTLTNVSGVALQDLVAQVIGPARCLNDGAAAVIAEAALGAGRGIDNLAYITVSTGIGGGLMVGGRLLSSASGLAGHIGFASAWPGDAACGSGRIGTVESVAGGRAMAAAAQAAGHVAEARAVCDAARAGAAWAEPIVERSASAVARLIGDLVAILGIERVLVGGSIGLSDGYLARVRRAHGREPSLFRAEILPATLGAEAPLFGALAHALGQPGA